MIHVPSGWLKTVTSPMVASGLSPRCCSSLVCKAKRKEDRGSGERTLLEPGYSPSLSYRTILDVCLLLGVLALIDAAYSGDWSRIGVITTDTEELLKKAVWVVVSAHLVCGIVAMRVERDQGGSGAAAFVKGLLFGISGCYGVMEAAKSSKRT